MSSRRTHNRVIYYDTAQKRGYMYTTVVYCTDWPSKHYVIILLHTSIYDLNICIIIENYQWGIFCLVAHYIIKFLKRTKLPNYYNLWRTILTGYQKFILIRLNTNWWDISKSVDMSSLYMYTLYKLNNIYI